MLAAVALCVVRVVTGADLATLLGLYVPEGENVALGTVSGAEAPIGELLLTLPPRPSVLAAELPPTPLTVFETHALPAVGSIALTIAEAALSEGWCGLRLVMLPSVEPSDELLSAILAASHSHLAFR